MLSLHILGREIVAIRWREQPPAPIAATPDPAMNGSSGLGGSFERVPSVRAPDNRFGFLSEVR
jgi:hypothetical protein